MTKDEIELETKINQLRKELKKKQKEVEELKKLNTDLWNELQNLHNEEKDKDWRE